jgi:PAS domain S-box-containing protein
MVDDPALAEQLRESSQFLQLILDNIPQAVFWKDRRSVYLGCNRNFAGDAGQGAPENVVGKTDYDLPWQREQSDFFRAMDRRVIETRAPIYHIIQYQIQADGRHYWVDTNKLPLFDASGEVVGVLGIEEKLRLSREQYELETDSVQMGTWEYHPDTGAMYLDVNLKSILGLEATRLSHTADDWLNRVHPAHRAQVNKVWREHLQGLASSYEQKYSVLDGSGRTRWVLTRGATAYDANGRARRISGIVADITSLKQAEDRLRRRDIIQEAISYATQQLLFTRRLEETLPEVLTHLGLAVGFDRAYVLQNKTDDGHLWAESRWLWRRNDAAPDGRPSLEPFPFRACDQWAAELRGGRTIQGFARDFAPAEADFCRARGIVSLVWVPIFSEGQWWGVLGFDSTDREALCLDAEVDALRGAAGILGAVFAQQRIQEAERERHVQEERQRLARDLHDAISQTLWTASIISDVLPALWDQDQARARADLEKLRRLNRGALAEMRTLLLELRPAALIEADLGDLLHKLAESTMSRKNVEVTVRVEGQPTCPPDVKIGLYRIAQESLNNVIRHARARAAEISLLCRPPGLLLTIADDGRGFDPGRESADHLGLTFMAERARDIGASLEIHSRPGAGTTVIVDWEPQ